MTVDKDLCTVMSTVDDMRNHMSEGQYLETCDALRRIHKKMRRPSIPHPTEIQIPITKQILFLLAGSISVIKILGKIKH